jgi:hypothetical protein
MRFLKLSTGKTAWFAFIYILNSFNSFRPTEPSLAVGLQTSL